MEPICFTIEKLLTSAECQQVIRFGNDGHYQSMSADYPANYRNNDRLILNDESLAQQVLARLQGHIPKTRTHDGSSWELAGLNSRFRGCRYQNGQNFTRHRDGAYSPNEETRSFLTVMFYLNDDREFEGGHTRFYENRFCSEIQLDVAPREGLAIIFDHDYWHDGQEVTSGTKYVLRTDVLYRRRQASQTSSHRGYIWSLIELDNEGLATGSRDSTIKIWNRSAEGLECQQTLKAHRGSVSALAELNGTLWSGGRDRQLKIWSDGEAGYQERHSWQAHHGAILALHPWERSTMVSSGADDRVKLWSQSGENLESAKVGRWPWCVSRGPRGRLWIGCNDGTLWHWVPGSQAELVHRFETGIHSATFRPEGPLCLGCSDGTIRLWNGSETSFILRGHRGQVTSLTIGPEGRLVSGAEDDGVRLWNDESSKEIVQHQDFVRAVCVTRSGRVVSGAFDGQLQSFELSAEGSMVRA